LWLDSPFVTKNQKQCLVKVTGYDDLGPKVGADRSDTPFTVEVLTITDPKNKSSCTSGQTCTIAWEAPQWMLRRGNSFSLATAVYVEVEHRYIQEAEHEFRLDTHGKGNKRRLQSETYLQ